ncbi:MAG: HepT-like ribonuclease domain-containing protein [Candidatus Binatus sp.]
MRLRHMLDHAREAVTMAGGKSRDDLDDDRKLNLALVRLLEIVGEAASRMPANERTQYPQIPWGEIVGLRNRLIHGYDSVDFDILWQIVRHDLPALIVALEQIVPSVGRV